MSDRDEGGFTLVELMVGAALMLLIGTLTLNAVVTGLHSQTRLSERSTALQDLRTAAQRMSREIRQADPLVQARDRSLVVDQPVAGGTRRLTWTVSGTDLLQTDQTLNAAGTVTSSRPVTTVARRLDPTVTPFGYVPVSGQSTCAVLGSTPTTYARDCIVSVTLHLSRTLTQGTPLRLDQNVELRNA